MARFVMALTGEVGAGKSTAAKWLAAKGATLLDADAIVRELWNGDLLRGLARGHWGDAVFREDGSIDKKAVADRIFTDEGEYAWLCGITNPLVLGLMKAALPENGVVVAEIPMLFEVGRPDWVDAVLFVAADPARRAERNSYRGLDSAELARRGKAFIDSDRRMAASDWVVVNDGTLDDLGAKLDAVWQKALCKV